MIILFTNRIGVSFENKRKQSLFRSALIEQYHNRSLKRFYNMSSYSNIKKNMRLNNKKVLNKTEELLKSAKNDIADQVLGKAFILMLSIPVMVLNDKYAYLMKKEDEQGRNRIERFVDLCLDEYEAVISNHVSMFDLVKVIKDESGVDLSGMIKSEGRIKC